MESWLGRTDKILVHEWAKLRWGVYEEFGYPGDEKFPLFYYKTTWGPTGQQDVVKPNFDTSTEVTGTMVDMVTGGDCMMEKNGLPDQNCYFIPDRNNSIARYLMCNVRCQLIFQIIC